MSVTLLGHTLTVIKEVTDTTDHWLGITGAFNPEYQGLDPEEVWHLGTEIGLAVYDNREGNGVTSITLLLDDPADTPLKPGASETLPAEAGIIFYDMVPVTGQAGQGTSVNQQLRYDHWKVVINGNTEETFGQTPYFGAVGVDGWYYNTKNYIVEARAVAIRIKHEGEYSTYGMAIAKRITREYSDTTPTAYRFDFVGGIYFSPYQFNEHYDRDFYIDDYIVPDEQDDFPDPVDPVGYIGGSGDNTSDTIPVPDKPSIGVTNIGFINIYNPAGYDLRGLGNLIFPQPSAPTTVQEAIQFLTDAMSSGRLIDYVVDCHIIPTQPSIGANEFIKVGYKISDVSAPRVVEDYVDFDCGTLNIPEYFASFADYMTNASLFLPFIGYVDVKPEYYQAGFIKIVYRFNVIDGSFMCYVLSTSSKSQLKNSVIAQYSGSCCIHIPITGLNYSSMVSGLVSAAAGAVTGASAIGTAQSVMQTMLAGPEPQKSNSYNSSGSFLSMRYPYLLIERPVSAWSANHRHDKGLPLNYVTTIGSLSGYAEIEDIDLSDLQCTDIEKDKIKNILASGFYI